MVEDCSIQCDLLLCAGLRDVYKAASSRPESNREELESLLNLISRLDFNGYFAAARTHAQAATLLGPLPKLGPRPS